MKTVSFLLILSAALSCGSTGETQQTDTNSEISARAENPDQDKVLTGRINKNDLLAPPYDSWFNENYDSYEPAEEQLNTIEKHIDDYTIEVFMGTWCPDSRREVPKLFKVLDRTGYDYDNLTMVAVDRNKTVMDDLEVSTDFEMVPTIVFYKNGKEVNRFVEFAQESFEEDIAEIVSGKDYKNPYAE